MFIRLLLTFFSLSTVYCSKSKCPKGWKHDSSGRSCYFVASRKMTQIEAHQFCHRLDANSHLLRIECAGENSFIADEVLRGGRGWIDARARFDIVDSSAGLFSPGFVFRWPNGKILRFTNWAIGNGASLVGGRQKCVLLTSNGKWQNAGCTKLATTICEKKLHRKYAKECPKHWIYYNKTASCYRTITRTNMTILDADNRCFQIGYEHNQDAMLASISSERENSFIMKMIMDRKPHFDFIMLGGFGRSNNGNKWHWMDGQPFKYQNWDRGMPFGKRALAVLVMNRRGKWLNHYADRILSQFDAVGICKFKP